MLVVLLSTSILETSCRAAAAPSLLILESLWARWAADMVSFTIQLPIPARLYLYRYSTTADTALQQLLVQDTA